MQKEEAFEKSSESPKQMNAGNLILIISLVVLVVILILVVQRRETIKTRQSKRRRRDRSNSSCSESDNDHIKVSHVRKPVSTEEFVDASKVSNGEPKKTAKKPKSSNKATARPTFERFEGEAGLCMVDDSYRFEVKASVKNHVELPKHFSAIKRWENQITGVFDQERCGSCWAHSTASSFTDRVRIKSGGTKLQNGDYLSPFNLAACMKCGTNNSCPRVCEGNYLDDVLEYLVTNGAVAQSDIDKHSTQGEAYHCFDHETSKVKPYTGIRKYRVNLFPPGMLNDPKNLEANETAIMEDIYTNGPVNCIIKVYVPNDKRNFYLYKSGIYGYGWKDEPKETDGYHAINILGWGEEAIDGKIIKYWIVRNSWGPDWGESSGLAKILKGVNFGMIESDIWAIDPKL